MKSPLFAVAITVSIASASCSSDSNPGYTPFPVGSSGSSGSPGSGGTGGSPITDASVGTGGGAGSMRCPFSNFTIMADGGCACSPGTDKICATPGRDGGTIQACIDSTSDPTNCGGCGNVCDASAACINGKCGKSPTALVAAATGCSGVLVKGANGNPDVTASIRLAFDGGKIYWTDPGHGTVKSIATTGGASTSLASGEMMPTWLVVNGTSVYWVDSGNNTIRVSTGGAAPTTLVTMAPASPDGGLGAETEGIHGIAVSPDGNTLYFSAGTDVYKVPKGGGAVVGVGYSEGPRHGIPSALAVDTKYVYYPTNVNGNVEVMSLTSMCDVAAATSAEPTCPLRQARSQSPLLLDAIYVRGDKLSWANGAAVRVGSVSAKFDAGVNGAQGDDYASTSNAGNITGFALGTANAYFGEDGFIERASNPPYAVGMTPNAVVIARKQPNPSSLAVDGTNVYWTTDNCDIQMIADSPQ
jgi:hypothetical protein